MNTLCWKKCLHVSDLRTNSYMGVSATCENVTIGIEKVRILYVSCHRRAMFLFCSFGGNPT